MRSGIKIKMFLILWLLPAFWLVGCKAAPDKSREEVIGREIDAYMSHFKSGEADSFIQDSNNQKTETRLLPEASAEGGEIVRYTGEGDRILRYCITYYGETGKLIENYYIIDDLIYYRSLLESYVSPISQEEAKTLSLVSAEGVIIDGICYEYNSVSHHIGTNKIETSYQSLQQLNELFETGE